MKAIVQFEINDDTLSKDELKDKLIREIAEICEKWIQGEAVLMIDFIETYENDEKLLFGNWNIDKAIN